MDLDLTPTLALFAGGFATVLVAIFYGLARRESTGSIALAAALCGGFAAFTGVTIATEGVLPVIANHTANLWGVQVWWDLLISVTLALFLIAPRARAQGMNLPLWAAFVVATASIGLLAMCARLFWLERQSAETAR